MNLPKALVLTAAATTFCLMTSPAFAVQETTPQNMTCQEFMDMNPKSMTPVAFWVVNRNTDFSGGDYVDWHEVETVSVPKCCSSATRTPPLNSAISARSSKITLLPGIRPGNPPRCGGPALLIDTAFARQMAADKLAIQNAPIIAPPPAPAAAPKSRVSTARR